MPTSLAARVVECFDMTREVGEVVAIVREHLPRRSWRLAWADSLPELPRERSSS